MPEPVSAKPVPKLRAKSASKGRPRPKTIHVDQDADVNTALQQSRVGPRGSISNISGRFINLHNMTCMHRFFLSFICTSLFYFAPSKGGMTRSDSRNSINDGHHTSSGVGGLSLASMGTGRHSAARAQTPSRRGSSVYIGADDTSGALFFFLLLQSSFFFILASTLLVNAFFHT